MGKRKINIGMIGYGFMGKAHSFGYRNVASFFKIDTIPVMKAICGRNEDAVSKAARVYGWESYETSYEKLINNPDIDVIDIITPPNVHRDMAVDAARAGKHVICEKPMANTAAEAKEMVDAINSSGKKHMMCFIYRKTPAITFCKKLITEGQLGKIYHFRAVYLCDDNVDPSAPLNWRMDKKIAGSGALGDIGAHVVDTARYLVGDIDEVIGLQEIFIKSRKSAQRTGSFPISFEATNKIVEVTADDTSLFLGRFKNGIIGSFEATTLATGRKNAFRIEINGSKGSVAFDAEDMNSLWFYNSEDPGETSGFRRIQVNDSMHPYMHAWWPAGHGIGYENTFCNLFYDFLKSFDDDNNLSPDFKDGFECQKVLDAVAESATKKKWVKI